ncbi:DUF433 domain-containing protein [Nocardia sp. NPDC057440]
MSVDDILADYPDLQRADILAVLAVNRDRAAGGAVHRSRPDPGPAG